MDYDARKDSLLSEQESEKVELYFTITQCHADQAYLDIYIQETNQPRKKLKQTKPQPKREEALLDFPESLVIDYFFESNPCPTQSASASSSTSSPATAR